MPDGARSAFVTFFDWGVHRADGWRTLLLTLAAYAACVGISLTLLRYVRRRGRPMLASIAGVTSLIPMVGLETQSVLVQLTTRADQSETHALAVAVTATALLAVAGVGVFAALAPARRSP